jgi:hypothetical protein
MQEVKSSGGEHREHTIQPTTSSYSSSHASDVNNNNIEKGANTSYGLGPRDDDAVTAKTWAVVVVSCSPKPSPLGTNELALAQHLFNSRTILNGQKFDHIDMKLEVLYWFQLDAFAVSFIQTSSDIICRYLQHHTAYRSSLCHFTALFRRNWRPVH